MDRPSKKQEMTEEQQRFIHALTGAVEGVCCAVEQETITAIEIDCLFKVLIEELKETFN